jgi:RNA polymerase sigma-70 factor (ECF subfamily)
MLLIAERHVRAPQEPPSRALVERAIAGDRAAFEVLYRRYARAVHGVLIARASRGEADDRVQEVFLSAWQHLDELREPAAFSGWLFAIARRVASRRPGRSSSERLAAEGEQLPEPALEPAPHLEAAEVLRALRALPEAYRETLTLRLAEGLSGPEIAELTGLSPGSVRVNLCRGMQLLREQLERGPR